MFLYISGNNGKTIRRLETKGECLLKGHKLDICNMYSKSVSQMMEQCQGKNALSRSRGTLL